MPLCRYVRWHTPQTLLTKGAGCIKGRRLYRCVADISPRDPFEEDFTHLSSSQTALTLRARDLPFVAPLARRSLTWVHRILRTARMQPTV
jgi:hypothetical protein